MSHQPKQRQFSAEHNDRTKPFIVEAGKIEDDGQGGDYFNLKYSDSFATLHEAQAEGIMYAQGCHFIDLLYVDADGKVWNVEFSPALER